MYGNQIIKDLKRELKRTFTKKNANSEINTEKYKQQHISVINSIRNSPQFYLGKFTDIQRILPKIFPDGKIKPFKVSPYSSFNAPYPQFLLCFDYTRNDEDLDSAQQKYVDNYHFEYYRNAFLVTQIDNETYEIQDIPHDLVSYNWILKPLKIYFTTKDSISQTEFYKENKNKLPYYEESMEGNIAIDSTLDPDFTVKFLEAMDPEDLHRIGAIVHTFITIVNCNNIVTETISKSKPRKGKKKKATFIHPLFRYKVLKVKVPSSGKKYMYNETSRENDGTMPVSWAIGHPKTYTEDAPLFGKHIGTWWWQPQVRGSKKEGFISKDYNYKIT